MSEPVLCGNIEIEFHPSGRRKAQCPSDPDYPHGKAVPRVGNAPDSCFVELPYPAPECGGWMCTCRKCGFTAYVTAAGRADDPVSFYMPCNGKITADALIAEQKGKP